MKDWSEAAPRIAEDANDRIVAGVGWIAGVVQVVIHERNVIEEVGVKPLAIPKSFVLILKNESGLNTDVTGSKVA